MSSPLRSTLRASVAACSLMGILMACSRGQDQEVAPEVAAEIDARLASAATGGLGFICTGTDKAWGCICKEGAGSTDPLSCEGMKKHCEVLGKPQQCGDDGVCKCIGVYKTQL